MRHIAPTGECASQASQQLAWAQHIKAGAPDYILTKGNIPLGYVEAKDVGEDLSKIERSEQLKRYREALPNLVLTDYLEFRWYVDGERGGQVSKPRRVTIEPGDERLSPTQEPKHKWRHTGSPRP